MNEWSSNGAGSCSKLKLGTLLTRLMALCDKPMMMNQRRISLNLCETALLPICRPRKNSRLGEPIRYVERSRGSIPEPIDCEFGELTATPSRHKMQTHKTHVGAELAGKVGQSILNRHRRELVLSSLWCMFSSPLSLVHAQEWVCILCLSLYGVCPQAINAPLCRGQGCTARP